MFMNWFMWYLVCGCLLSRAAWARFCARIPQEIEPVLADRVLEVRRRVRTANRTGAELVVIYSPISLYFVFLWPVVVIGLLIFGIADPKGLLRFAYGVIFARLPKW